MKIHWLPLTLDETYIRDMVNLAQQYHVTDVHLSHKLVHNADDIIQDEDRLKKVQKCVQIMKEQQLDIWCWTHEVLNPPEECIQEDRLDLDHPALWTHLERKYTEFLKELLPEVKGFVLTFAETQFEVYKAKHVTSQFTGKDAAALRTKKLVDHLYEVCKRNGKVLAIRDFVYRLHEIDDMLKAIDAVNDQVIVMSKCVPHDWHPFYPDNPVLGKVGSKEQWIEFDLGHEYEMQTVLPYAEPYELYARIQNALKLGIEHFCLRLDRYDGAEQSAIYQPWGQLELLTFSMVQNNPEVSVEQIISEWEQKQYPGAWEIVKRSTDIVKRMLFPKKLWLADHSNLPTFEYARTHLKDGNADRLPTWTGDPEDALTEEMLNQPTLETYHSLLEEDELNVKTFKEIKEILEANRIPLDQYTYWDKGIKALEAWMMLFKAYKKAYFAIRMYQNDSTTITKDELLQYVDELEAECIRYKEEFPRLKLTAEYAWETHPHVVKSLREQIV